MLVAILIDLVIAGIAGWIAGRIMKYSKSPLWTVCIGLIGGVVGSITLAIFGLYAAGVLGSLVVSVIGACIAIFVARLITK
jgi:uncharacterized membrane protein YeaQ/YmgE (transglycosylase-associated protein family)